MCVNNMLHKVMTNQIYQKLKSKRKHNVINIWDVEKHILDMVSATDIHQQQGP